jgi:hypothetical protein
MQYTLLHIAYFLIILISSFHLCLGLPSSFFPFWKILVLFSHIRVCLHLLASFSSLNHFNIILSSILKSSKQPFPAFLQRNPVYVPPHSTTCPVYVFLLDLIHWMRYSENCRWRSSSLCSVPTTSFTVTCLSQALCLSQHLIFTVCVIFPLYWNEGEEISRHLK